MTVAELRAALAQMPDDAEVTIMAGSRDLAGEVELSDDGRECNLD